MGMDRRPLVWTAASWVVGSAAAAGLGPRGALLVMGAAALLAASLWLRKRVSWPLAAICLLALCLAAGQRLWADARNATALEPLLAAAGEAAGSAEAAAVEARGVIISAVEVDGDRVQFRMKAEAVHAEGFAELLARPERLMVQLRLDTQPEQEIAAAWARGDAIVIAGELTRPAAASNSGGFDYRRYLSSQRIHWLLKARGASAVAPAAATAAEAPRGYAAAMLGRVDAARAWMGARLNELYPSEQSGYMQGLILGLQQDIDPKLYGQFSQLGLTHILAISGLHVGVFLFALGGALRLLRQPRERILTILTAAVPFYVLLTGASPSILRAGLMAVLGLVAARMGKLKDGLHLLAAAAMLLLIADPYYLDNVSFQLSFIVTLGLILGVPPVRRAMPRWNKAGWLLDLIAVTVVAQLISFPITIFYFNQFHLLSLPANLILVPIISFGVMPAGAFSLLVSIIWQTGGEWLAVAVAWLNDWTFVVTDWMAQHSSLRTIWPTPTLWWVASWLALMGALFRYADYGATGRLQTRIGGGVDGDGKEEGSIAETGSYTEMDNYRETGSSPKMGSYPETGSYIDSRHPVHRFTGAGLLAAALVLLCYGYAPDWLDRTGTVSFLDVGQGDAALIRTPSGKHILIDGGGSVTYRRPGEEWRERRDPFETGAKVVVPLLMKRGARTIDVLIVSHLDSDHIRGLLAVLDHVRVKQIWWNGTMKTSPDAVAFLDKALQYNIPLYAVSEGMDMEIDDEARIDVWWPAAREQSTIPLIQDQNNHSLVMSITIYGKPFLFAGDINSATERAILRKLKENQRAETGLWPIMKAAHHGSRHSTSEDWLAYWQPAALVASAGAWNTYGHPHPDTMSRAFAAGAAVWRTDLDGEVAFRVDSDGMTVSKMK